jgi:hypothetical protein
MQSTSFVLLVIVCTTFRSGVSGLELNTTGSEAIIENCQIEREMNDSCQACHDRTKLRAGACFVVARGGSNGAAVGANPPPRPQVSIQTSCNTDGSVNVLKYYAQADDTPCSGSQPRPSIVKKKQCVIVDGFENDAWGYKFVGCV